ARSVGAEQSRRAWQVARFAACDHAEPLLRRAFWAGRLTCGSRQDGAIELGARLPLLPLLPGRCSSPAGQPRATPRVRTTSAMPTCIFAAHAGPSGAKLGGVR